MPSCVPRPAPSVQVIAGQAAAAAGNGAAGGKAGGGSAEFIAGLSRQQRNNMLARDA